MKIKFKSFIANIFFKHIYTKVILYTFFALILFDFTFVIGEYNSTYFVEEYKEIPFHQFLPLFYLFVKLTFVSTVFNFFLIFSINKSKTTKKNKRFLNVLIITLIFIFTGIIKLIILGIRDLSVIRLAFYIILPAEAGLMVYLEGFKFFRDTVLSISRLKIKKDFLYLMKLFYDEYNFFLDKLITLIIFLGTIFGVAMSIMWIAPSLSDTKPIKSVYSICIIVGFFLIALELFLWYFRPLWENKNKLRNIIIKKYKKFNS